MFICNVKINSTKIFKAIFVVVCISIVILFGVAVYKVMFGSIKASPRE